MNTTRILSDDEAADFLKMLPARLKRLAKRGEIPRIELPDGVVRFDEADLKRWVEAHKREAAKP